MPSQVAQIELPELDVTDEDKRRAYLYCCATYGLIPSRDAVIDEVKGHFEEEIRQMHWVKADAYCRNRQLLDALTQLSALELEGEKLKGRRVHTQEWYASHYARLHDWARKVLPEPYRNQFFSCVANGTYDGMLDVGEPYMCKAGFMVTPSGYIPMDDAKGQIIREQTSRAEDAELRAETAESNLSSLREASEWVSVEERFPETQEDVDIVVYGDVGIGYFNTRLKAWVQYELNSEDSTRGAEVTFWRNRPLPPQPASAGKEPK